MSERDGARLPLPLLVLAPVLDRWEGAKDSPSRDVLRLACLRDLARLAHAGLSQPEGAKVSLQPFIHRLEALRDGGDSLSGTIQGALTAPVRSAPPVQLTEPALIAALGREKLFRYDRAWEAELAGRAYRAGWKFWEAQTEIPVRESTAYGQDLERRLWPSGFPLFCEAAATKSRDPSLWRGAWTVALDGRMLEPARLAPDAEWKVLL